MGGAAIAATVLTSPLILTTRFFLGKHLGNEEPIKLLPASKEEMAKHNEAIVQFDSYVLEKSCSAS